MNFDVDTRTYKNV